MGKILCSFLGERTFVNSYIGPLGQGGGCSWPGKFGNWAQSHAEVFFEISWL